MFYECRVDPPQCSEKYQRCQSLFLEGDVCAARDQALKIQKLGGPEHPNDFLLCSDISRSFNYHEESWATIKLGLGRFSKDIKLQIQWCRVLALRGYFEASNRLLIKLLRENKDNPKIYRALLANIASLNAKAGFINKTTLIIKEINSDTDTAIDPQIGYDLTYASILLRNWDEAINYGRRTVQLAPRWMRARVFLIHSLLAKGQVEEATTICKTGLALSCSDASFEFEAALLAFSCGKLDEASERLITYGEKYFNGSKRENDVREFLAYLLYELGRNAEAIHIAQEVNHNFARRFENPALICHKTLLAMPVICQGPLMCVPTAVSMVASPQDIPLHPDELFKAMHGQDGTALWRMCDVMEQRGYLIEFINVNHEAITGLLKQGIALIGELEYLFSGHVEVICGFDEGIKVYYIRDPEHWIPYIIDRDQITDRYKAIGNYVIAVIAPTKKDSVYIHPDWISQSGNDLIQLAHAQALGERKSAEQAYAALKGKPDAEYLREIYGRGIAVTPLKSRQALERVVGNENIMPLSRIKALLDQESYDTIDNLLNKIEMGSHKIGKFIYQYIEVLKLRHNSEWQKLLHAVKQLLRKHPGTEALWVYRAEAHAELGQTQDAQKSISMGLEIAPKSSWIKLRSRSLFPESVPIRQQITETRDLINAHPDHHHLKQHLAELLLQDDNGIEFERTARGCLRFEPRSPEGYYRLANWYLNQDRDDLARHCLEEGRNLMGIEELPYWDFEEISSTSISQTRAKDETEFLHSSQNGFLNDTQQLFLEAREVLNTSEKIDQHPDKIFPIPVLMELYRSNQLQWFEAADLFALRILLTIKSEHFEWLDNSILPKRLPGPGQLSLNLILSRCVTVDLYYVAAKTLLSWAQGFVDRDTDIPATLLFNLAVLHEALGEYRLAESEYQDLQKAHSAFDAVSYRLGQIFYKREDWDKAIAEFRKTIDSTPGHLGALKCLITIHKQRKQYDKAIQYQQKICQIFPYSFNELASLFQLIYDSYGYEPVISELQKWSKFHREGSIITLKARYLLNDNQIKKAYELLEGSAEAFSLHPRYTAVTQLECALSSDHQGQIETLLQKALKLFPCDPYFLHIKGDRLQKIGPKQKAINFYRHVILNQSPQHHFINRYLDLKGEKKVNSAIELIGEIDPELRNDVILGCAKALTELVDIEEQVEFLRWCYHNHPRLKDLQYGLASRLELLKKYEEANEIADKLLNQSPEVPHLLALKARIIQDLNPKEAIPYLQKAYDITGTLDYLTAIGRSHLLSNNIHECRKTMFKVLKRNPTETLALTNLIVTKIEPDLLFDNFYEAINLGLGVGDQYFHVGAVMAARSKKKKLPLAWIETAKGHFRILLKNGGYQDEKDRLALAIAKWLSTRGHPNEAKHYRKKCTVYARFILAWIWPGTHWIPRG